MAFPERYAAILPSQQYGPTGIVLGLSGGFPEVGERGKSSAASSFLHGLIRVEARDETVTRRLAYRRPLACLKHAAC